MSTDWLLAQKACMASCEHPQEEGQWTPEQTQKMEASGFFEQRPKSVHIFGRVYFMSRSDYKALVTLLTLCLLCLSVMLTYAIFLVIHP